MATGAAAAVSVIIPPIAKQRDFSGDPKVDKEFGIKQFIADINKSQSLQSWTDAQTAAYALSALKGPAAIFIQRIELDDAKKNDLNLWSTIVPLLEERFAPAKGFIAADIVQDLRMTDSESFMDFLDRCTLALQKINEDLTAADRTTTCYKHMFNRELTNSFLNGVYKKTRTFLMTHHKDKSPNDLAVEAASFWASLNEDAKKKGKEGGGNKGAAGSGGAGADLSAMSDTDVMAMYQDSFVEQFDTWRKANPSGGKTFRFQPPKSKRGGRGGAQNNGGGNKKPQSGTAKSPVADLSGEEQYTKYKGYDPNKILCHNCWQFGDHFASQCPNSMRQKPAELCNYFPASRRGAWRGGWRGGRGRGTGGFAMNPVDATNMGYGYYQQPPPPAYQQHYGQIPQQQQPNRVDQLETQQANLAQTVGVLLNNQAAMQQNQAQSDQGSTVYPNIPSPFPSLNY